jgi:hypothetical protein
MHIVKESLKKIWSGSISSVLGVLIRTLCEDFPKTKTARHKSNLLLVYLFPSGVPANKKLRSLFLVIHSSSDTSSSSKAI